MSKQYIRRRGNLALGVPEHFECKKCAKLFVTKFLFKQHLADEKKNSNH